MFSFVAIRDMFMPPVFHGVQYLANGVGADAHIVRFSRVSVIVANSARAFSATSTMPCPDSDSGVALNQHSAPT